MKWIGEGILLKDKHVRKQEKGFFFPFMISKVSVCSPWLYSFRIERREAKRQTGGLDKISLPKSII